MLAIGTTVLGATLVVYGTSKEVPESENVLRIIQTMTTITATAAYLLAFLYTARTIFPPPTPEGTSRLAQKRRMASSVISLFGILAMSAAVVILIEIISSDSARNEKLRETSSAEEHIGGKQPEETQPDFFDPKAEEEKPETGTRPPTTAEPTRTGD